MVSQKILRLEGIIEDLEQIHDSKILKQKFKDRLEDLVMELDELKEEIRDDEEDWMNYQIG